ncbi:heat-shock protein [Candidatus Enterovibrio escicola]|uniref:heat-shock protein n=1 Tax=Candidatus Enterovibrio escicola TaxID=1927127 RepID=UPI001CC2F9A0|nr:heat-shock protein [Candidatus Enterovibrio escacola]
MSGNDVLNPRLYLGEGSLDGAFVISRARKVLVAKKNTFNLADNEVQKWTSFDLDSELYNFEHLNACKHRFSHPERDECYTLYFTFSHHVFTRSIKQNESFDNAQIYPYPSDERIFDLTRFELSKYLPQIVATLPEQFCYHGGYSRYCSCKISQEDGTEIHYQVVYRVWKQRGKMRFHIESAYPLLERVSKVKKVNFWVICHNLLRGKKLPKPAK